MDKVILEKKQLPSAVGSEMSILIKTFIFKYISCFICSDMCLLRVTIQTPGLRKLEKGILIKDMNSKIKTEKGKEKKIHLVLQLFFSLHIRLFFTGLAFAGERPVGPLVEIWFRRVREVVVVTPHSHVRSASCVGPSLLLHYKLSPCASRF